MTTTIEINLKYNRFEYLFRTDNFIANRSFDTEGEIFQPLEQIVRENVSKQENITITNNPEYPLTKEDKKYFGEVLKQRLTDYILIFKPYPSTSL